MTLYETASLVLSAATLVTVVVGLLYATRQLRNAAFQLEQTRVIHQDNHDWNRRNAAQEALRQYNYSLLSSSLQEVFDYLSLKEAIPLETIQEGFRQNPNIKSELHQLLNYYEALARGVHQGVFDEGIVKAARKNAMIIAARGFGSYIDDRRKNINPYAWTELSALTLKWISADQAMPYRQVTGVTGARPGIPTTR